MSLSQFSFQRMRGKYHEYFGSSPRLFLHRLDLLLQRKAKFKLGVAIPASSDAIVWVMETKEFHSRVYLFNYWTEHYGAKAPTFVLEVRDEHGKIRGTEKLTLRDRETRVLESLEILARLNIPLPFTGSFFLKWENDANKRGIPIKLLQEYYSDNALGSIHEYGTFAPYGYRECQTGVTISPNETVEDVQIGLVNCNLTSPSKGKMAISLLAADGKKLRTHQDGLGGGGSTLLSLKDLFPNWRTFLSGQMGNISIESVDPIGRPLIFHRHKTGKSLGLNHATGNKTWPAHVYVRDQVGQYGLGPIWASGVVFGPTLTSCLTLLNHHGFNLAYDFNIECFDLTGRKVHETQLRTLPSETTRLDLRPFFPIAGEAPSSDALPYVGSVKVSACPHEKYGHLPVSFDANMEFEGNDWRQPANIGSSILNLGAIGKTKSTVNSRSKVFVRAFESDEYETGVLITNHSSNRDYRQESETCVRLLSSDGEREQTAMLRIPPNGATFITTSSLFPNFRECLGSANVGMLHFRDTKVKLMGIHLTRNKKTNVLSGDHWFGG